jgi:hypothetical protein
MILANPANAMASRAACIDAEIARARFVFARGVRFLDHRRVIARLTVGIATNGTAFADLVLGLNRSEE